MPWRGVWLRATGDTARGCPGQGRGARPAAGRPWDPSPQKPTAHFPSAQVEGPDGGTQPPRTVPCHRQRPSSPRTRGSDPGGSSPLQSGGKASRGWGGGRASRFSLCPGLRLQARSAGRKRAALGTVLSTRPVGSGRRLLPPAGGLGVGPGGSRAGRLSPSGRAAAAPCAGLRLAPAACGVRGAAAQGAPGGHVSHESAERCPGAEARPGEWTAAAHVRPRGARGPPAVSRPPAQPQKAKRPRPCRGLRATSLAGWSAPG